MLPEGGQIIAGPATAKPVPTAGHVTTSCMSPTLGRSIALGLLDGGHGRVGESVTVWAEGKSTQAEVASNHFYDAANARLKM